MGGHARRQRGKSAEASCISSSNSQVVLISQCLLDPYVQAAVSPCAYGYVAASNAMLLLGAHIPAHRSRPNR